MRRLVADRGLENLIEVDSAGTAAWHVGKSADTRSAAAALRRGVVLEGSARQVTAADFERFDLLVAMDRANERDLIELAPSPAARAKVRLLLDDADVPDPYYGGDSGFDDVLDLVEAACERLLEGVTSSAGHRSR